MIQQNIPLTNTKKEATFLVESLTLRYDPMGNSPTCTANLLFPTSIVHLQFFLLLNNGKRKGY